MRTCSMNSCPSSEQLHLLLAEELGAATRTAVIDHVDGCRACQERLDRRPRPAVAVVQAAATAAWSPSADFVRQLTQADPGEQDAAAATQSGLPDIPGFEILDELGRGGM